MFSKTSKPARQDLSKPAPVAAPEPARKSAPVASAPKMASMLTSNIAIEGNVSGAGEFQVDGHVKGDVQVSRLVVGETGSIEGSIKADIVEIRGRVIGSITGGQVRLFSTAYVEGDIAHEQLSIEVGTYFQGRCLQTRKAEPAPAQISSLHAIENPAMGG